MKASLLPIYNFYTPEYFPLFANCGLNCGVTLIPKNMKNLHINK